MVEWTDSVREIAFASNEDFINNYCRQAGYYATLNKIADECEVTFRRELADWLSKQLPNSFHRTPGHSENQIAEINPKWLICGKLCAQDGRIDEGSWIEMCAGCLEPQIFACNLCHMTLGVFKFDGDSFHNYRAYRICKKYGCNIFASPMAVARQSG